MTLFIRLYIYSYLIFKLGFYFEYFGFRGCVLATGK